MHAATRYATYIRYAGSEERVQITPPTFTRAAAYATSPLLTLLLPPVTTDADAAAISPPCRSSARWCSRCYMILR